MNIYVIRWASRIDGEEESGNFEVAYTDESKAREAMLKDFKNTKEDWENGETIISSRTLGPNGEDDENCDYAEITDEKDTFDYYEWHIDKIEVE